MISCFFSDVFSKLSGSFYRSKISRLNCRCSPIWLILWNDRWFLSKVQDSSKSAFKLFKARLDERLAKDYSIIEKGNSHYIMKDGEKTGGPMTITAAPIRPSRVRTLWHTCSEFILELRFHVLAVSMEILIMHIDCAWCWHFALAWYTCNWLITVYDISFDFVFLFSSSTRLALTLMIGLQ